MAVDIILIVVLSVLYFIILRQSQFNALISSISLLLPTLTTKLFAASIENILTSHGYAKEGDPIVIFYFVTVVILWGILYAVLLNIPFKNLDTNKGLYSLITSVFFTIAIGIIVCFSVSFASIEYKTSSSWFCKICHVDEASLSNNRLVILPNEVNEVIKLPSDFRLEDENRQAEAQDLSLINNERSKNSLAPVAENIQLQNLAVDYSKIIIDSLRFSHLDVNNNSPSNRAYKVGIRYTFLGENLAIASDVIKAHEALMDSKVHRENILSNRFMKVGISAFNLSNGSVLLVEEFSD